MDFVIPNSFTIFAAVNEIEDGRSPIFCYMDSFLPKDTGMTKEA